MVGDLAHHRRSHRRRVLVQEAFIKKGETPTGTGMEGQKQSAVLITGSDGYLGRQLLKALARERNQIERTVAVDVRDTPEVERQPGVEYLIQDVRSPVLAQTLREYHTQVVVHLASIVTPGKKSNREFEHSVDVLGTQNVLEACIQSRVHKLILTSSGAAYGYHPDNPAWLEEHHALRGNPDFPYSDHKRQVEEMLSSYRVAHPELQQLIFRPGTILGHTAHNQITALFRKPVLIGLMGVASPFVFIWDEDVVACLMKGIKEDRTGIYNLAGDGVITLREMASEMGKAYLPLPVCLVRASLWILKRFGLTRYGPEQIGFLRYRPVLSNRRLKETFGYTPQKTTREVFEYYLRGLASPHEKDG
jgi:UDP-glucose 4-epimerase